LSEIAATITCPSGENPQVFGVTVSTFIAGRSRASTGALLLALAAALLGCGREDIQVYRVARDKADPATATDPHGGRPLAGTPTGAAMAQPDLTWKAPAGWEETPPGEMRLASFRVKGAPDKQADVSIIPLPGFGGGDLDNVNRWRGQVGLPPVKAEELAKLAEKVEIAGADAQLYDQAGQNPAGDAKSRILAAILRRDGAVWFFKMTGDDQLVAQEKPRFVEFLKSIEFRARPQQAALPPSHPPLDAASVPAAAAPTGDKPNWTVPSGWKEEPPTQMLLAKFTAADKEEKAEITVSVFPGDGGGLLPNVNRWRGQLGLEPLKNDMELAHIVPEMDLPGGGHLTVVDFTGTDSKTGKPARLVGVVVPQNGQTWFYKLMGDAAVVAREKPALLKFVQSAK
jgi:hypothetical protein